MIQLHSVSKRYRDARQAPVLDGVDLAVAGGEVVLLSGATGSGKSTLIGLLYGVHPADAGRVEMFGRDVARLRRSSVALLRQCLGIVPQELALINDRTALDNVALALEIRAESRRTMRARAAETLGRFGLACHVDVRACELSLGERQRLALARAWVTEPAVVIADEPSAHLDSAGCDLLVAELCALQARGGTALVATMAPGLLAAGARLGWRQVELFDGTLRAVAEPAPAAEPVLAEPALAEPRHQLAAASFGDYECIEITTEIPDDRITASRHWPGGASASGPADELLAGAAHALGEPPDGGASVASGSGAAGASSPEGSPGEPGASSHVRPRRPGSIDELAFPEGLGDFREPKADVVLFPLVASGGGRNE